MFEIKKNLFKFDINKIEFILPSILACSIIFFVFLGIVFASDGSGTNTVTPTSVYTSSTGNTLSFTFTASENMDSGGLSITVPTGWSSPQGSSGTAGYTISSSASGILADVLNNLDSSSGWSVTNRMTLSSDTGDKQEGAASLSNTITTTATANEQWYFNYSSASDWGVSADGNLRVGMWLKSSVSTASGDISWMDDDTASLASPLDTISIPALSADTWTYTSATLGATSRNSILSYGFRYTNDIGATIIKTDSISVLFQANDSNTGWSGDANISNSSITGVGDFKEGTGSVRCTYAAGAGTGTSGDCFNNEGGVITVGPGTAVSFWVRSSVALNAGDFAWVDDNSNNLGSADSVVNLPALSANTWTYVTVVSSTSADMRAFGVRQLVDKGAMTIDIDAIGKRTDACDVTTGWIAPTSSVQAVSVDNSIFHEGSGSLKNIINSSASSGDKWYENFSSSRDWSGYTSVGFWIRSSVNTQAGDLTFQYSTGQDLASPIASLNIGALTAGVWSYQKLTLTGTRTSINSYGINYFTDIGAATIYIDDFLIGPGSSTFPGGGIIGLRFLELASGQTVSLVYGSGGGSSGATAPSSVATSTFITKTRISDNGTLTEISSSPEVSVSSPAETSIISKFSISNPGDMTVGARIGYSVSRLDQFNALFTSGTTNVYLYTSSAGVNAKFYDAASGGNVITSVNITNGNSSASFWYYDDQAGNPTITVSDNVAAPDGTAGIDDTSDAIVVSTEPVTPPVTSTSTSTQSRTVQPTIVTFSGKAFPSAKIFVTDKDVFLERFIHQDTVTEKDGSFSISFVGVLQSKHSFGLVFKDKEGRTTQSKFFNIDTLLNSLTVKNILVPPTLDFIRSVIRRGDNVWITGYATPSSSVRIEIDGKVEKEIVVTGDGSYKVSVNTGVLDFGLHSVRAKQIDKDGKESDFSLAKSFTVSKISSLNADLNSDNVVNLKDLSIFLNLWSTKGTKFPSRIDFNNDGKINISDFSIFVKTIRKR